MNPRATSGEAQPDEPLYLRVIDLGARIAIPYFVIVAAAVVVDLARGDRVVFRSWTSFAIQAAFALFLATVAARRILARWQEAGSRFVPANVSSASVVIGAALGAGTLAGGFFPDALNYQRRAPEMFFRTVAALVPMAIAVYAVLRPAAAKPAAPAAAVPSEPPLTGDARAAAVRALETLDRGEQALTVFQQRVRSGSGVTSADAERLWKALDGPGYVTALRQMPPNHAVTKALREAAVAQTDAAYLIGLAGGAHGAMGHTADSARALVDEVAVRRGQPGTGAEALAGVARHAATMQRDIAADRLHASRF